MISESGRGSSERAFRRGLALLYLLAALALIALVLRGLDYYGTPFQERPHHEDYGMLRPAGSWGHGLGILGSLMMILLLGYSLRKRWRPLRKLGSLPRWLSIHIFLGIFGPLLVVLHSSFKVGGLVSISFWSMVAVAGSGVLGRYLYLQIPRNLQGDALDLRTIEAEDAQLARQLVEGFGLSERSVATLRALAGGGRERSGGALSALFRSLLGDLALPLRLRLALRRLPESRALPRAQRRRLIALARREALLTRRIRFLERLARVFHYWHVLHKPFAVIMLIIMIVHVTITVLFGYRWIL